MTILRRETDQKTLTTLKGNGHLLLLFVVLFVFIVIVQQATPMSLNVINSEKNEVFATNWQYNRQNGEFEAIELPYRVKIPENHKTMLKNTLPHDLVKGATILFRTSQQSAEVRIDGKQIYSTYDESKKQQVYTSAYHFVRMPTDGADKEISIILSSPYKKYTGTINQIYLGSKASNLFFVVGETGWRFILGAFVFCLGIMLAIIFGVAKGGYANRVSVIYIGAFFAAAGLWVMMESKLMQFIVPRPILLTNLSLFSLMLMPIFMGLYYHIIHAKIFKRTIECLILFMIFVFLGISCIACVNPMLPMLLMPAYMVILGLYTTIIFISIVIENRCEGSEFSLSLGGILIFGICSILELLFYVSNQKGYLNSTIMVFGLIIFCILMLADTVQNYTKIYQEAIKVDTLTKLAYTDSLTNLKNRTAFLERMSKISEEWQGMVSLAMFDINNLKLVNDTKGHLVGDAMIIHGVKTMVESLRREDELYRIGGDEFAAILLHDKRLALDEIEQRIVQTVERENKKTLSYELSFAYGFATFSEELDKTLYETLERADGYMYGCKKEQKKKCC